VATMNVTEKYTIDKEYECKAVFKTVDKEHPGVEKVMAQAKYNLAGPIKVLSEIYYPEQFKGLYQRPANHGRSFQPGVEKDCSASAPQPHAPLP